MVFDNNVTENFYDGGPLKPQPAAPKEMSWFMFWFIIFIWCCVISGCIAGYAGLSHNSQNVERLQSTPPPPPPPPPPQQQEQEQQKQQQQQSLLSPV